VPQNDVSNSSFPGEGDRDDSRDDMPETPDAADPTEER
jgi:hypothetical protein